MVRLTATDCPPLYATVRDPARPTLGGDMAAIAEQLGSQAGRGCAGLLSE
jgi:hypothetical protein